MTNLFKYFSPQSSLTDGLNKRLATITSSEINLPILEKKLRDILVGEFSASGAAFVLVADFVAAPPDSLITPNPLNLKYARLEKLQHRVKQTMILDQLTDPADKQLFADLGIALILPLTVQEEDLGLLLLGPIKNHKSYRPSEIKSLESVLASISIAIKNALSYRKIQELSASLESKVIARTHELQAAQEAQLKLKDEFVFIATHDIATPVAAITGFVALINSQGAELPSEIKNYLDSITQASNRLSALVKDLLEVARSDSNTIKLALTQFDAKPIIESVVETITPLVKQKNIQLVLALGNDNLVLADPAKLAEVFENLLSNGVKYNKVGGELKLTSSIFADQLVFTLTDTGIGIDPAESPKVFTKFFRSDSPEARKNPGTGLGLFVARMLTQKMGGKISFTSVLNQGTTFTLTFNR